MRIITGIYKGKKINSPKHDGVRPTADRIKESLFNIINDRIENSIVLDLFGGTGALGIECLSRGANKAYIVDNDKRSIELIKQNLVNVNNAYLYHLDYNVALLNFYKKGIKFDIIFIDPPYATKYGEFALKKIFDYDLLNEDGIIVWEYQTIQNKNQKIDLFEIYDNRNYGETSIIFLKKKSD